MLNTLKIALIVAAAMFVLAAAPRAQDAALIDITNLDQLNATRYDLDGDGAVSFTTADDATGSFGTPGDEEAALGDAAAYAQAFPGGTYYNEDAEVSSGTIEVSTAYTYKIDDAATYTGYELTKSLDFNTANSYATSSTNQSTWTSSGEGWTPIGSSFSEPYAATFDGNGHTISNLYINSEVATCQMETLFGCADALNIGLFGTVGSGGEIRRLGLEEGSVTSTFTEGNYSVAGLVGYVKHNSTVRACYFVGTVTVRNAGEARSSIGGLAGINEGTIEACYSGGSIVGEGNEASIGGLIGQNYKPVMNSYSTASVEAEMGNNIEIGGFVGYNFGEAISVCYATGAVTVGNGSDADTGGFVGYNEGDIISGCYATGTTTGGNGDNAKTGGFAGSNRGLIDYNTGFITACYSIGPVIGGRGDEAQTGGFAGSNSGTINASYSIGIVKEGNGVNAKTGGLIGFNLFYTESSGSIEVIYTGTVLNSYFDSETSGISEAIGENDSEAVSMNVSGKTSIELRTPTSYSSTSGALYYEWNRDTDGEITNTDTEVVWDFGTNGQYPVLKADFDNDTDTSDDLEAQRQTRFLSDSYSFSALNPNIGMIVGTVSAIPVDYNNALSYMISSQRLDGNDVTVFDVSEMGAITMSTSPTMSGVYTLAIEVIEEEEGRATTEVSIEVRLLSAPVDLSVSNVESNSVTLTWGSYPNECTGFSVLYSTSSGFDPSMDEGMAFSPTPALDGNATGVIVTGLSASTTYYFRVAAVHGLITGPYTEQVMTETLPVVDNDMNDNGLIEVTNLDQLDAIRYDLDGDGVPTSAGIATYNAAFGELFGSEPGEKPADVDDANPNENDGDASTNSDSPPRVMGYELANALDFNDIDGSGTKSKWAEGASGSDAVAEGWLSIGDNSTNLNDSRFTSTFDGNGHTISNLYIARSNTDYVGLFGWVNGGTIRNLGLERGNVTGGSSSGTLAGHIENKSTVELCYSTGSVEGTHNVGGLVGHLQNSSSIRTSYSMSNATGNGRVGGLAGHTDSASTITICYSTGSVEGTHNVGGLVGHLQNGSSIRTSYSIGNATGTSRIGGLVGANDGANVIASYFDSDASNRPSTDPYAKTTSELQSPTTYSGIYETWNVRRTWADGGEAQFVWELCSSSDYPKLNVDFDGNGTPSAEEFRNNCSQTPPTGGGDNTGGDNTGGDNTGGDNTGGATSQGLIDTFAVPSVSSSGIVVHPNPTSGRVQIKGISSASTYIYTLYTLIGQRVQSGSMGSDAIIDLSRLTEGQYFLFLKKDGGNILRTRLLVKKK